MRDARRSMRWWRTTVLASAVALLSCAHSRSNGTTTVRRAGDGSEATANSNAAPSARVFRIQWRVGDDVYDALLILQGSAGRMRVRYSSSAGGSSQLVEQQMRLQRSQNGLMIIGSSPIDVSTEAPHSTYAPDSFLIVNQDGHERIVAIDTNMVPSSTEFRDVSTRTELLAEVKNFDWQGLLGK
jgi:hypothetical protein